MIGPSPKKSHTSNTSIIEDLVIFSFTWVLGEHNGSIHGNLMGTWVPPLSTPNPTPRRGKTKEEEKWALVLGMLELMKFFIPKTVCQWVTIFGLG